MSIKLGWLERLDKICGSLLQYLYLSKHHTLLANSAFACCTVHFSKVTIRKNRNCDWMLMVY